MSGKTAPLTSASWHERKTCRTVWIQGAAVRTMTFAGCKVAVFPILLPLPLFPAHLHTQLLPAQAALVSTSVQKFEERSPTVLVASAAPATGTCAVYKILL